MTRRDFYGAVLTLTGALTALIALIGNWLTPAVISVVLIAAGLITLNEAPSKPAGRRTPPLPTPCNPHPKQTQQNSTQGDGQ